LPSQGDFFEVQFDRVLHEVSPFSVGR